MVVRQAIQRGDAPAIAVGSRTIGYRDLDRYVWRVATSLRHNGVNPGDVVALTFVRELNYLVTLLATARAGATVLSLPANLPAARRRELAGRARASRLVSDRVQVDGAGLPVLAIDFGRVPATIDASARDPSPSAPLLCVCGSGSTGVPKVFFISHAQFQARAVLTAASIGLRSDDRLISVHRLDFTSPKERFLAAISVGATIILSGGSRQDLVSFCAANEVTVLNATVFHAETLLEGLPAADAPALGRLRVLQIGASTVTERLRRLILQRITPNLYVRYATNETGLISIAGPETLFAAPGSVGTPLPGVTVQVIDEGGAVLPPGRAGRIRVQSPAMADAYADDGAATAAAFRDGWFLPGDLGMFSPQGALTHLGRADGMMIMNGINIYPAEIERTLAQHPVVREAIALALRSRKHQDIPVCAVSLAGPTAVTGEELRAFAVGRLGVQAPRAVVILERFPRDDQGKVMRPQLLQDVAAALQRRPA